MTEAEERGAAGTGGSPEFEALQTAMIAAIRRHRGPVRGAIDQVQRWFSPGLAHETHDDWLRLRRAIDHLRARYESRGALTAEIAQQLATAGAYLEIARSTADLAEAWSFVNQASEILCGLVEDQEKPYFLQRLSTWDPILHHWLTELYDDAEVPKGLKKTRDEATEPCHKLAIHAQQWHLINQWISFSRRLWRLALLILVVALGLAVAVAEHLYEVKAGTPVIVRNPFIWISVLGLFAGALSALLTAGARKVTAITYGQSRSQVFIRLALGASGAFVVYVLVQMPGFLNAPVKQFFGTLEGFIALGIVAGFSERLFKDALDRLAKQFPTSEPAAKGKTADGKT